MSKYQKGNVLVIADTHIPFGIKGYLDFCLHIMDKMRCGTIVHIGDLVDNHTLSFHHDVDPNGYSPMGEIKAARENLQEWFKAFPLVYLCLGNHDRRVDLKGRHVGLPDDVFRPFREIWGLPKGWQEGFHFVIDGVKYSHGTGYSGENSHLKAASFNRQSSVIGHTHTAAGIGYLASEKDCIFGMNVGCGIDRHQYAFAYQREYPKKPIVACGVVTEHGRHAELFPMEL